MIFSSPMFLFIFLPVTFFMYAVCRSEKSKNICLSLASIIFYACGDVRYLPLLIISSAANYFFARSFRKRKSKAVFILTIVMNAGTLLFIKCIASFDTSFAVPLGMSFYTFQAMSYVIDCYRDETLIEDDYIKVFLYISFFPRLLAGPIEKYSEISPQLSCREISEDKTTEGIERFIFGFAKKMLIAVPCAKLSDAAFEAGNPGSVFAWLGALAYMLEIYYDFSGYSDMAIGTGKMFGFDFHENFNLPYASLSLRDFWRRWHISLSSWFKAYVYIPLGGNRKGKKREVINTVVVFLLTGLWHGISPTYFVWGLGHGALLSAEKCTKLPEKLQKIRCGKTISRVYTLLVVCLLFVIFRSESLQSAFSYILSMFSFKGGIDSDLTALLNPSLIVSALCGIFFAFKKIVPGPIVREVLGIILLVLSIMAMAGGNFTPFIYMQF